MQALSIPTKISRGTIEIVSDVPLIAIGDKVGMSEATLLNMLNISPFSYGLLVMHVYDNGSVFSPKVLDITDDDLKATFMAGVANVAAVSSCLKENLLRIHIEHWTNLNEKLQIRFFYPGNRIIMTRDFK